MPFPLSPFKLGVELHLHYCEKGRHHFVSRLGPDRATLPRRIRSRGINEARRIASNMAKCLTCWGKEGDDAPDCPTTLPYRRNSASLRVGVVSFNRYGVHSLVRLQKDFPR